MKLKDERMKIEFKGVELEVVFDYSHDSGYWRDSNGDGLPPSADLTITSVFIYGTEIDIYEMIEFTSIMKDLEEHILESVSL